MWKTYHWKYSRWEQPFNPQNRSDGRLAIVDGKSSAKIIHWIAQSLLAKSPIFLLNPPIFAESPWYPQWLLAKSPYVCQIILGSPSSYASRFDDHPVPSTGGRESHEAGRRVVFVVPLGFLVIKNDPRMNERKPFPGDNYSDFLEGVILPSTLWQTYKKLLAISCPYSRAEQVPCQNSWEISGNCEEPFQVKVVFHTVCHVLLFFWHVRCRLHMFFPKDDPYFQQFLEMS